VFVSSSGSKSIPSQDEEGAEYLFRCRAVEIPQVPAPTIRIVESKDRGTDIARSVSRLER
jgi:hypothetical protein